MKRVTTLMTALLVIALMGFFGTSVSAGGFDVVDGYSMHSPPDMVGAPMPDLDSNNGISTTASATSDLCRPSDTQIAGADTWYAQTVTLCGIAEVTAFRHIEPG